MLEVNNERDRVRIGDRLTISFQRTLRIPDDDRTYPLPPGLGPFPLRRVEEFGDRVPAAWRRRGGVFLPMYQREALWIGFEAAWWKPNAVKVGLGMINALSGRRWDEVLHADPQDYIVCPEQPWLDGIKAEDGRIRQFVAMPLKMGYTIEAQVGGEERVGGLQVVAFDPRPGRFPDQPPAEGSPGPGVACFGRAMAAPAEMGLAAGGRMKQKIYPDPYGIETWDPEQSGTVFVHIVNSELYRALTGEEPPPSPIDVETYTALGLPWFDLYDEARGDLPASETLAKIKSIRAGCGAGGQSRTAGRSARDPRDSGREARGSQAGTDGVMGPR